MLGLQKVQKMSGKGLEKVGNKFSKLLRNPALAVMFKQISSEGIYLGCAIPVTQYCISSVFIQ